MQSQAVKGQVKLIKVTEKIFLYQSASQTTQFPLKGEIPVFFNFI